MSDQFSNLLNLISNEKLAELMRDADDEALAGLARDASDVALIALLNQDGTGVPAAKARKSKAPKAPGEPKKSKLLDDATVAKVLETVEEQGGCSASLCAELTGFEIKTVSAALKYLEGTGEVTTKGQRRGKTYHPFEKKAVNGHAAVVEDDL